CVCVFFFQAEDGIRDWSVTGVQTCALPISPAVREILARYWYAQMGDGVQQVRGADVSTNRAAGCCSFEQRREGRAKSLHEVAGRSEERRVGKERRARGWP